MKTSERSADTRREAVILRSPRRSLTGPILIGVVMILLLLALTVGWIILSAREALAEPQLSGLYWTLLSVGTVFLGAVLVGVVFYLALTVKAINLNRRQTNFVDSVTHELKSPIASLKLYLQTLTRHPVEEAERDAFHRHMLEDVERLDELIDHLLDAARVHRRDLDPAPEEVELAPVLHKNAEKARLRYRAPLGSIRLEVEPVVLHARPLDVELVFRNLIDNAVKYAGAEPEVIVEARPHGGERVLVRISDNGRGIPPRFRRKVFGRFVRLGRELEREKPGTGLGLYIARTLVRRMRGSIEVRPRGEGKGTVFELTLPGGARRQAGEAGPAALESGG
jgi:signal transduction histidine kinase